MGQATADDVLDEVIERSRTDYDFFNSVVLARGPYWWRQREICDSLMRFRVTAVPAGNGIGKSFIAAGIIAAFASLTPGSKTVVAAPTQAQLAGVVWSELEAAYASAAANGIPLGGRMKSLTWDLGPEWRVEGFGSGSVESKSGRHAKDLLAVIDEASGVSGDVLEAIDSLNPSRYLYLGNPLRPDGKFFDVCEGSEGKDHINVIRIPSLESPHIDLERSPHGMADRGWLEAVRAEYGEESIWWLCHVLAQFPGSATDTLIPRDWLDLAEKTIHVASGPRRMGIDVSKGNGGDKSSLCVRDDNGILDLVASNRWDLPATASRAALLCAKWGIEPGRVTYDANGIGDGMGKHLADVGLLGCKAYLGSNSGGPLNANLRTLCAWTFRQRLNPNWGDAPLAKGHVATRQKPFSIPPHIMKILRPQLQALRYELTPGSGKALEAKAEFAKRVKRSPDESDSLFISYAFPHA
jgi:hypothetical protein